MRTPSTSLLLCLVLAACGGGGGSGSDTPSEPGDLQVTSVSPGNGTLLGGTRLTIRGSGFSAGVTAILVGGVRSTEVSSSSDTTANCTSPAAYDPGSVDVTVQTNAGSATLPGGYRYNNPPLVLGVAPPAGFAGGELTVSILGLGFASHDAGPPIVLFGDTESFRPQVVNDTLIFATTPPLPAGLVDVTVINANGEGTLENGFLYMGGAQSSPSVKLEDVTDAGARAVLTRDGEAPETWAWPDLLRGRAAWTKVHAD